MLSKSKSDKSTLSIIRDCLKLEEGEVGLNGERCELWNMLTFGGVWMEISSNGGSMLHL